jgi:hypothetical protein
MSTLQDLSEINEREQDKPQSKIPYTTPQLEKLGNVKQVTEGAAPVFAPDNGTVSDL